MRMWKVFFASLVLALVLPGCGLKEGEPMPKPFAEKTTNSTQIFLVKGVVQEVKPEEKTAVIKHEEIPGYMSAMTMPLEVKDVKELDGLQPGDTVTFRMIVTQTEGWIDQ